MSIKIEQVSKSFEGKEVLKDFSLELPEKGVYSLLGASGSGKTTLLRLIAGLDTPDSGRITGTQSKKISFVFQGDRLLPGSTALENVAVAAPLETAKLWLKRLELDDAADKKPDKLSGGMCRRVALARALAFGGDILLLDEPFKGFDSELKKRIMPYIVEFSKNSLVVLVTHDEQEAQIADETFRLAAAT
ncbi:MAG TPA: ATP-binding cassette domain-containing protein [Clostridia bacterium]|nr:ATP-binding cassette domain-containing protein [Clostridia bacterium]